MSGMLEEVKEIELIRWTQHWCTCLQQEEHLRIEIADTIAAKQVMRERLEQIKQMENSPAIRAKLSYLEGFADIYSEFEVKAVQ